LTAEEEGVLRAGIDVRHGDGLNQRAGRGVFVEEDGVAALPRLTGPSPRRTATSCRA